MTYNMKTKISFFFAAMAVLMTMGFVSCVKQEFDEPPASEIPVGDVLTIADLRQMYADSSEYTFDGDYSVYATVTMDESTGNIYRTAFIQDATDATYLFLNNSGGVTEGDSIRLYLNGCTLSEYGGVFQVKDVDNDSSIVILANEHPLMPQEITLAQMASGNYESKLVKLTGVQFASSELGKTWAESSDYGNRTIEDDDDNTAIVRTSSYASFGDVELPEGSGSMIGIASRYNETMQFYVRSLTEVEMTGDRFGNGGGGGGSQIDPVASVDEDFSGETNYEDIAADGWTNISVQGDRMWQGKEYQSNLYAQATGYNSGLSAMETWLITPPVINTSGDRVLKFESAMAYWEHSGDPLTILVSTDFTGDNFASATWTEVSATLPTSSSPENEWIESGDIDLSAFTGNVSVAFKYVGSDTESTSIRIDNVTIDDGAGGGGGGGTNDPVDELLADFEEFDNYDDIIIDGWLNVAESGTRMFLARQYDNNTYAQATAYGSGEENISWLVTPPINLQGQTFSFRTKDGYDNGAILEVMISTDFDGTGNPWDATWTDLEPEIAGGTTNGYAQTWTESGDITLPSSGIGYIVFRYTGDDPAHTTTFQIDDVNISLP